LLIALIGLIVPKIAVGISSNKRTSAFICNESVQLRDTKKSEIVMFLFHVCHLAETNVTMHNNGQYGAATYPRNM
jgi:hypothetical protein